METLPSRRGLLGTDNDQVEVGGRSPPGPEHSAAEQCHHRVREPLPHDCLGVVDRLTRQEITASFDKGWKIDSIDASKIDITISSDGALAWRVAVTRT